MRFFIFVFFIAGCASLPAYADFGPLEPFLEKLSGEISMGRIFESYIVFWLVWRKVKPKLADFEKSINNGFSAGEKRFEKIENSVILLQTEVNQLKGAPA